MGSQGIKGRIALAVALAFCGPVVPALGYAALNAIR
jgi:hypothetical protein